jgi:hypothetical protein
MMKPVVVGVDFNPEIICRLRLHRHPSHHQQEHKQGVKSCCFHLKVFFCVMQAKLFKIPHKKTSVKP